MAIAKRRAIDRLRRDDRLDRKLAEIGREPQIGSGAVRGADVDAILEDDGRGRPAAADVRGLPSGAVVEARVALTLRLLGGLTTDEIARAFLVPEPTIAQRIVRAKRTLADGGRPVRGAGRPSWLERLASVLEVVYLIFNEGYSATAGDDWMRPELCHEALRLGRMLAELMPDEPEVHGLRRADGDPGVACRAPGSAPTASRSCWSTRTGAAGTGC